MTDSEALAVLLLIGCAWWLLLRRSREQSFVEQVEAYVRSQT